MAKTSKIAAQRRRETIVARYAEQRATLKEQARTGATLTERQQALRALSNPPREASPTRLRNRDVADGRPRGYIRKAGVSRVKFRQLALRGELPGITKSSW